MPRRACTRVPRKARTPAKARRSRSLAEKGQKTLEVLALRHSLFHSFTIASAMRSYSAISGTGAWGKVVLCNLTSRYLPSQGIYYSH